MSLINKRLQDLDARGGAPGAGADPLLVKAVARPESRLVPRVAVALGLLAVLAVGGWFSWRAMVTLRSKPPVPVVQGPMPLAPVRTVSRIALRSMASRKASFLPWSPVSSTV